MSEAIAYYAYGVDLGRNDVAQAPWFDEEGKWGQDFDTWYAQEYLKLTDYDDYHDARTKDFDFQVLEYGYSGGDYCFFLAIRKSVLEVSEGIAPIPAHTLDELFHWKRGLCLFLGDEPSIQTRDNQPGLHLLSFGEE